MAEVPSEGQPMESPEVLTARRMLLSAVMQGRKRPAKPLVNPVVDRKRSPVASGLVVADLELCSEPGSPQGWVPMRLIWDPRALGPHIPPAVQTPPTPTQTKQPELESNVQRQLQLKLQLYDTDSGPSLEPQQCPLLQPKAQTSSRGQSTSTATQTLQHPHTTSSTKASANAPRAIVGPPKYPEQVAQAKGMDAANVALQSLCTSPYDSPPPEKASAPSPRSGPPKAAAVPLSPQNYEALTFLSTPHYQGPEPPSPLARIRNSPSQSPVLHAGASPPSLTPTPSAPLDNSLSPSSPVSEHSESHIPGMHTPSPDPSPTPTSPTSGSGNQPSFSRDFPPSSLIPSPLERISRRKSSFSFPFPQLHPAAPTPHPSPPMTPPLRSAGAPGPASESFCTINLPPPTTAPPTTPVSLLQRTSHAASRPTFVHQGSQVWVNTEGAYDDTHSHSPRQELHSGKGLSPSPGSAHAAAEAEAGGKASSAGVPQKLPVVIFLHATGSNMDSQRGRQEQYAFAGYFTVAIDCRYHGERQGAPLEPTRALQPPIKPSQKPVNAYQEALVRAWQGSGERPFLLDNVFDIICCLDYLAVRPEVDMKRVGITGVSLGGMHAWLTAVVDQRIAVTAPMIGVQGFGWAIHHNAFQARVDSIPLVFEAAARDMSKPAVDAEVVKAVWRKLLPGMLGGYDAPFSLPELFPRPFIIVNGELDPRCPMPGVLEAFKTVQHAYMRRLYLTQQKEKGERRERQRKAQAEEDARQRQAEEQREKEQQIQPPDPRNAPAKPQRLTMSKISPGTSALITAETIASLPPVLPISDCEGEAYQECQREMWRLEAERAAEHAAVVEAVNTLTALYVEPRVGHAETAGMHKAVKEFLDIYLKGPTRRQTLSSSTRAHLISLAT